MSTGVTTSPKTQLVGSSNFQPMRHPTSAASCFDIGPSIVMRSPFGCSKVSEEACRQSRLMLALPNPWRLSPTTGQPMFVICTLI